MNITKKVSDKKVPLVGTVGSVLLSDKPISKRAKYTDYDLKSKLKFSQLEHSIYLHNELHQSKHNTATGGSSGSSSSSSSSSSSYGNHTGNNNSGTGRSSSSSDDVHRSSGSSNNNSDHTGAISDGSDRQSIPLTESNLAMNDPLMYCAKQKRR